MTHPDTTLLKASVDSALLGLGKIQQENGALDHHLEKVREFERLIGGAHAKVVKYICDVTGQSRKDGK